MGHSTFKENEGIVFPFPPMAKGRPRASRRGYLYTPTKTRNFEDNIKSFAKLIWNKKPLEGPIRVLCRFVLERPKTVKRPWPSVTPDVDNYCKALFDALNGVVWLDDCQVVDCRMVKVYDETARIEFFAEKIN